MKRATVISIFAVLAASTASAQTFDLGWSTIDGGGAMWTTGGSFELSGTIGQPDAQTSPVMSGGTFTLTGGFWAAAIPILGDMDCDGVVNFDDINAFVAALVSQESYEAAYPNCRWLNGDINGDTTVNFDDINPFVDCLVNSGCP
jgi:hypothetical protein